ncbi:MAG TPA: hypothetical protein DCS11_00195 [Syntrophus sp. (in: bacteria)]|jgi:dTDP-glucose pyrophosphorylase|nr:hypothetical protein [Syntrophus sp. (in: bacteria)]
MHDLTKCTIGPTARVRDALLSLEVSGVEIVLVVDGDHRLVGILTDGDLRRAILQGTGLEARLDSYLQRKFISVSDQSGRAEVLDLMQARGISQIPIVDDAGRLIGLHTLHAILGSTLRGNWAVILAGGRGERLRPLTDTLPKPMIKVAGRPILERTILHLVGFGITTIYLAVNYMAEMVMAHFNDGGRFGCKIHYLHETKPLGTGGPLSLLSERPRLPFLVLNGDLLTQFDVGRMLFHHENQNLMATVGIQEYVHTVPYGVVEVNDGRILGLREKPAEMWHINTGIYVLDPCLLDRIPPDTFFPLPNLVEECIDRGEAVGAFRIEEDWMDVGRHHDLKVARGEADR